MRILIATASRHGSTRQIAQWISLSLTKALARSDLETDIDVRDVADVDSIAEYDAVIIGCAVYMGRWLRSARKLVAREQAELETRPVWLFSSGPIGARGSSEPHSSWDEASWAEEHRVFGGKLDLSTLSVRERLVVRLIRARDGDDRSRDDVEAWAREIGARLAASTPTATVT
jgi:menaquinone-dependent protoporphyrinogen oxidase